MATKYHATVEIAGKARPNKCTADTLAGLLNAIRDNAEGRNVERIEIVKTTDGYTAAEYRAY